MIKIKTKYGLAFPYGAQSNIWCTAEGTLIPVSQLERSHLRCIVSMLLHSTFKHKLRIAYALGLKGAPLRKLLAMPASTFLLTYCPTWEALTLEMVERGITVNDH